MFNNEAFNQARREAGITSAALADFMGISRSYASAVERCREPATPDFFAALNAMIAAGLGCLEDA